MNFTYLNLEICEIPPKGYHVFSSVHVNGQPFRMVVDSGSSRSILNYQSLAELGWEDELEKASDHAKGLGDPELETHLYFIRELKIGDIITDDFEIGVLNLSGINQTYEDLDLLPVDGILGNDLLIHFKARIDFEEKHLAIKPRQD